MEVLLFQQLIKVIEPLQCPEEPVSLSFCTLSVIPDADCCQLQHSALSVQPDWGCVPLEGQLCAQLLALQCEWAAGAALAVPVSLSGWVLLLVGFCSGGLAWGVLRQSGLVHQGAQGSCGTQDMHWAECEPVGSTVLLVSVSVAGPLGAATLSLHTVLSLSHVCSSQGASLHRTG